jgi:hypothetical protein
VTSLLYENGFITPDDERGFIFVKPFNIVLSGFESWMGITYPDFDIKYATDDTLELFKDMQRLKTMVRDYKF